MSAEKMGRSEKFTYGFGNLAANLMITTANTFITFFYTDVVGLSLAAVGTILGLARLFDGISDLVMGGIVDKTQSKYGKARPWLLWMAIPYALALVFLFSSPGFLDQNGKFIWAFVSYVVSLAGIYTMTMVPYNSMIGTTALSQEDRNQLSSSRTIMGFAGALFVNYFTLNILGFFGQVNDVASWTKLAILYGIVSAVFIYVTFKNSRERATQVNTESHYHQKISAKQSVSGLLKNKYWLIVITVQLLGFISSGLGGVNVYYAQWILGDINKVATVGLLSFLPIAVGAIFMPPLLARFSKKSLSIGGSLLSILGLIIVALAPSNYTAVLIGVALKGLGLAPFAVAGFAMLGDTADYGEYKTGIRSDGLIFSAGTFGEKVGSGLGAIILSIVMSMGGYVANATSQTASALFSMQLAFTYIPIALSVVGIILLLFYNLDKEYPTVQAVLEDRKKLREIAETAENTATK